MSGLSLVLTGGLLAWAFRLFPKGHRARRFSALAGLFLVIEALLGAGLVLFDYVAHNASAGRAVYMSAHLANTMVLVALVALTAWSARLPSPPLARRPIPRFLVAAIPAALLISITGALAALGDTLFPATSFEAGVRQDFAEGSHALLRLRMVHPVVAIAAGIYVALAAALTVKRRPLAAGKTAMAVVALVFVQLSAGFINLLLLAPVWMQIVHLLLANVVWVALVMLVAEVSVERLSFKDQLARA
jgi:heme A synthase